LLMRARLTPATARLADTQMRRSAVPAMAQAARRLRVDADWIVLLTRDLPALRDAGWTVEVADPWGNVLGFTDYTKRPELGRRT